MSRPPRRLLIPPDEVGTYHIFSRTVRRTFLMGEDAETGKSYLHRLDLLYTIVRSLARLFAIDILGFGFMQNHFHEILRNRPDLVKRMSNYQVALRSCLLSDLGMKGKVPPTQRTKRQQARLRKRVQALMKDPDRLHRARKSLSCISCYEKRLKSTIARLANREDGVTGHFWSGRFESIRIEDEAQLLKVMVYVDLNPVRAGIAQTPEDSRYTSAYERIHGFKARQELAECTDGNLTAMQLPQLHVLSSDQLIRSLLDDWLSPIDDRRASIPIRQWDWLETVLDDGEELWRPPESLTPSIGSLADSGDASPPVLTSDSENTTRTHSAARVSETEGHELSATLAALPDSVGSLGASGGSLHPPHSRSAQGSATEDAGAALAVSASASADDSAPIAPIAADSIATTADGTNRQRAESVDLPGVDELPARVSNRGCLSMTLGEYLAILDWTGRQMRSDKRGQIPNNLQPILERLGFEDSDAWLKSMADYRDSLQRIYSAPVNQPVEAARCLVQTPSGLRSIPDAMI